MPNLLDDGMLITKIHHLAKFHQSIVETSWFVWHVFRPPMKSTLWSLSPCKVWLQLIQYVNVSIRDMFGGLNTTINTPKLVFWCILPPTWEAISTELQKVHPCVSPRRSSRLSMKSRPMVWPVCRQVPKKGINKNFGSPMWPGANMASRRGRRCNHLRQIFCKWVEGCQFCGGLKIDIASQH